MKSKTILMALAMMTTALAGCTGTDGVTEVDEDALNELIQDNLQDFINNTTVVVNQDFHYHNNTTIDNTDNSVSNVNGSGAVVGSSSYHAMAGTDPNVDPILEFENVGGLVLLVGSYAYLPNSGTYYLDTGIQHFFPPSDWDLDGVVICVGTGTAAESNLAAVFSAGGMSLTVMNVGSEAEAAERLKSHECMAIATDGESVGQLKSNLLSDLQWNETWVASVVPTVGFHGLTEMDIVIHQAAGTSTRLLGFMAQITVTGECITNCSGSEEDYSLEFKEVVWIAECVEDYYECTDYPDMTMGSASSGSTVCEFGMEGDFNFIGPLFGAGMECEHTITTSYWFTKANALGEYDGYEFSWGDWSYIAYWESAPVTMHE